MIVREIYFSWQITILLDYTPLLELQIFTVF